MRKLRLIHIAGIPAVLVVFSGCTGAPRAGTSPAPRESVERPDHPHKVPARTAIQPRKGVAPGNAAQAVADELKRLPQGQIAFQTPDTMKRGQSEVVVVRVAKAAGDIRGGMHGEVQIEPIQVSAVMKVQMAGANFLVTPLDPESQIVSDDRPTQWDFEITPKASGDQTLSLTASVEIQVPGMGPQLRAYPVLSRKIHVRVDAMGFVADNWQWLAGTIFLPLMAALWQSWRKKKAKGAFTAA